MSKKRGSYQNKYFEDNYIIGQMKIDDGDIDPDEIDQLVENILKTHFNVSEDDLLEFKANRCLAFNHSKIYPITIEKYSDSEGIYDNYLSKSRDNFFIHLKIIKLYVLIPRQLNRINIGVKKL